MKKLLIKNIIKKLNDLSLDELNEVADNIRAESVTRKITMKCLCCENPISFDYHKWQDRQEYNLIQYTGSYGSYLDDEPVSFIICNNCLEEKYKKEILLKS